MSVGEKTEMSVTTTQTIMILQDHLLMEIGLRLDDDCIDMLQYRRTCKRFYRVCTNSLFRSRYREFHDKKVGEWRNTICVSSQEKSKWTDISSLDVTQIQYSTDGLTFHVGGTVELVTLKELSTSNNLRICIQYCDFLSVDSEDKGNKGLCCLKYHPPLYLQKKLLDMQQKLQSLSSIDIKQSIIYQTDESQKPYILLLWPFGVVLSDHLGVVGTIQAKTKEEVHNFIQRHTMVTLITNPIVYLKRDMYNASSLEIQLKIVSVKVERWPTSHIHWFCVKGQGPRKDQVAR